MKLGGIVVNKNGSEIWKALPGVPGVEVSTFGNVRMLDRVVSSEFGTRFTDGRVLNKYDTKDGYLQVCIPVCGKWATKTIHRLVAQTFIPNPDNLPEVNHKDNDRTNNNVENLEWVTHQENIAYREKYGHTARNNAPKSPVFAVNLSTLEVSRFPSQNEASRILGLSQGNINSVIKGKYKSTGGLWFTNDDENAADIINRKLHDIGKTRTMINMEGGN